MNGGTCNAIRERHTHTCSCVNDLTGTNCGKLETENFKYLVIDETKSWDDSRDDCQRQGYNLTSISTDAEMNLLSDLVR